MPSPAMRGVKRAVLRMPRRKLAGVEAATVAHRKTMDRVLDRSTIEPLKLGVRAEGEALRKILAAGIGSSSRPATKGDLAIVRRYLDRSLLRTGHQARAHLLDSTKDTQVEAARSLAKFAHSLSPKTGTSLDDEAMLSRLVNKHRKALEAGRRTSSAALTQNIRMAARDQVSALSLEGMTAADLVKKAHEIASDQWWQVERTVRTENSVAFNTTQHTAMKELAKDIPGLMMRWTELISDITGAPFDDRVGKDSMVLHGQVARPGQLFVMPPHPLAPSKMVGKKWAHPPNRPNDRAVLTPWAPGKGVVAWQWVGERRVTLK